MRRVGRDDEEAAYFTLLRAREELTDLRRYEEFLEAEERRLYRFVAEGDALEAHVTAKLRRGIAHTDRSLGEAIRTRLAAIEAERRRLPERIRAAEDFVDECEAEHARMRDG